MREDLFRRLRRAGVVQLVSLTETSTPLIGQKQDPYLFFDYELVLLAPMDTLRKLVNILQEAYRDNVVYSIRDISLSRAPAGEKIPELIAAETKDPAITLIQQFQTPDFEVKDTDENLLAGSYRQPMVGKNNNIEMRLSVRFILYIANRLERVDSQKTN